MVRGRSLVGSLAAMALAACDAGRAAPAGSSTSASTSAGSGGAATGGAGAGGAQTPFDIGVALQKIPGLTVAEEPASMGWLRYFVMTFDQPADHGQPAGPHFQQRLTLLYRAAGAPVVLASTGYDIDPAVQYRSEPARILDANQILVEHRFFSPSRPSPADWSTLTIEQAAADHHAIVLALKPLLAGKWISTGASKGGMTSVYHRRFHAADVDGTVAYVAPQSYGIADARYVAFLQQVGDPTCRAALSAFQLQVLGRRPAMMQRLAALGKSFSLIGADAALDYAVVELPFSFWQYFGAATCAQIPAAGDTDDDVWSFLELIDPPELWADDQTLQYEPYYWQAATQLGYPKYDDGALTALLKVAPGSDVAATFVVPGPGKTIVFHPESMTDVATWLSTLGKTMMFVYGADDPYSAAAFDPAGAQASYRFFAPSGNHGSTLAELAPSDQQTAYKALETWTGVTPMPTPPPSPKERWAGHRRRPQ